jgi:YVTN family beta-propeller protein
MNKGKKVEVTVEYFQMQELHRVWRRIACIVVSMATSVMAIMALPPGVHAGRVRSARGTGTSTSPVRTIHVGQAPWALVVDSRTRRAFVRRADSRIAVIDTASLRVVRTIPVPQSYYEAPADMAIDEPLGRVFVVNSGDDVHAGTVTVLDATSGARLQTVTVGTLPTGIAVDPQTGRIFVANSGHLSIHGSISILDAARGTVLRTVPVGIFPFVAVDDRRGRVFVSHTTGVTMLDATTGVVLRRILKKGAPDEDTTLAVDSRSGHIVVAPTAGNSVRLVDPASGRVMRTITVGGALTADYLGGPQIAMAVAQRTGHVFVAWKGGYDTGQVTMLAGATGRVLHTLAVKPGPQPAPPPGLRDEPTALAVDERLGRVFVACLDQDNVHGLGVGAGAVSVLDATSGALLTTLPVGRGPSAVAVDESTQRVFVLNNEGTISVFDARVGRTTSPK